MSLVQSEPFPERKRRRMRRWSRDGCGDGHAADAAVDAAAVTLLGSEDAVSGIAQTRNDIAVIVELFV